MKSFSGSSQELLKILKNYKRFHQLCYSSLAQAKRTNETNPALHKADQIGLFYSINEDDRKRVFSFGGFPKPFMDNVKTFTEASIMIREPALEIIDYLKRADYNKPTIRYVLYGKAGLGKSLTVAHILHYAYCNGFYLLHVPWVWDWFRNNRIESAPSTFVKGILDFPVISANWLKHFQAQNEHFLSAEDEKIIKTSQDYVWNQRETTPAGSPLSELVIHGINRVKYSGAVVSAIINELKLAASAGRCKVLVAIDGFNGFYSTESKVKAEDKSIVPPNKCSLVHCFLEATKQDWKGGAVVVTVDQRYGWPPANKSPLPVYLLTRKGFEHLDPFVPVEVKELTSEEFHSMLDYYEDRLWFQKGKGRDELAFLSNRNAGTLMKLCASL
ncbi:small ribosomal subunit protein mS29 isoform X1 [Halyomorpha halys]|uniref:small ribosomal subunit protein mS29 isoform X1 n=2 Tax=Halyomorpha halys TaxID=286706 RepID=UPI0006D4D385|nr:28S ribosomal protein S29, mitochondrial [Halyomorpha halys]